MTNDTPPSPAAPPAPSTLSEWPIVIAQLRARAAEISPAAEAEPLSQEGFEHARISRALRQVKRLGINPQGESTRSRPELAVGQAITVDSEYVPVPATVQKIKADGRLALKTEADGAFMAGEIVEISGFAYEITSSVGYCSRLRPLTVDEIFARKATAGLHIEEVPGL